MKCFSIVMEYEYSQPELQRFSCSNILVPHMFVDNTHLKFVNTCKCSMQMFMQPKEKKKHVFH